MDEVTLVTHVQTRDVTRQVQKRSSCLVEKETSRLTNDSEN